MRTTTPFLLPALLVLFVTSAPCAASETRSLAGAMREAVAQAGHENAVTHCDAALREHFDEASRSIEDVLRQQPRDPYVLLWVVAEDGRISSTRVARPGKGQRLKVSFRGDDLSDDSELSPTTAAQFNDAWRQLMTGKIADIKDVADGSCTLAYDGKRARLFLPGQGVPTDKDDALETALKLFDNIAQ
jgi:hypothetical protein